MKATTFSGTTHKDLESYEVWIEDRDFIYFKGCGKRKGDLVLPKSDIKYIEEV